MPIRPLVMKIVHHPDPRLAGADIDAGDEVRTGRLLVGDLVCPRW
jgi:hypothetical protein